MEQFSFSTHAGHQEILDFAKACEANVVVYHTDPNRYDPLWLKHSLSKAAVHQTKNGESYVVMDDDFSLFFLSNQAKRLNTCPAKP